MVKNLPANARDWGSIPGSGRFPGEGNGNPLQYSCWKIPWTEKPGRLQSMGSPRVGHHLGTKPPPPSSKNLNFMVFRERLLEATFRVRAAGYMTFF